MILKAHRGQRACGSCYYCNYVKILVCVQFVSVWGIRSNSHIQRTVLHTNKNTLILLSGKSTVRPCLFICWRNLISESLAVALPSQASSSPSVGLDLAINPQSPKESPCLSQAPTHIYMHLASKSLETFHFYVWARAQAPCTYVCVCVCSQKMQKNHRMDLQRVA